MSRRVSLEIEAETTHVCQFNYRSFPLIKSYGSLLFYTFRVLYMMQNFLVFQTDCIFGTIF